MRIPLVLLVSVVTGLGVSGCLAHPEMTLPTPHAPIFGSSARGRSPSLVPGFGDPPPANLSPLAGLSMVAAKRPTHRVRRGETFYGIARQYRVPLSELLALNPDVVPTALETGARVLLPGGKPVLRSVLETR